MGAIRLPLFSGIAGGGEGASHLCPRPEGGKSSSAPSPIGLGDEKREGTPMYRRLSPSGQENAHHRSARDLPPPGSEREKGKKKRLLPLRKMRALPQQRVFSLQLTRFTSPIPEGRKKKKKGGSEQTSRGEKNRIFAHLERRDSLSIYLWTILPHGGKRRKKGDCRSWLLKKEKPAQEACAISCKEKKKGFLCASRLLRKWKVAPLGESSIGANSFLLRMEKREEKFEYYLLQALP